MTRSMIVASLQQQYHEKNLTPQLAGMFLLDPVDVPDYIETGRKLGLQFQGLEGFTVFDNGGIQPSMEFSLHIMDSDKDVSRFLPAVDHLLETGAAAGMSFEVIFDLFLTEEEKLTVRKKITPWHKRGNR